MSGAAVPEDFPEPLEESLFLALDSALWEIDWWEGDPREEIWEEAFIYEDLLPRAYFIRPRVGSCKKVFHGAWRGTCRLLTTNGCRLPFDFRPKTCRDLVPTKISGPCVFLEEPISCMERKRQCVLAWLPHNALIKRVGDAVAMRHRKNRKGERRTATTDPATPPGTRCNPLEIHDPTKTMPP